MEGLTDNLIGDLMIAYAPLWDLEILCDKRKRRKWARKRRKFRRRINRELYEKVGLMQFQVMLAKKCMGFEGRCEIKKGDIIC